MVNLGQSMEELEVALDLVMEEYDYLENPMAIAQVADEEFDLIVMPSHIEIYLKKRIDQINEERRIEYEENLFAHNMMGDLEF
tara:strand:- start:66978 stop:67226 length:249 start_codon:yes stop_codon:yes gene_type:complete